MVVFLSIYEKNGDFIRTSWTRVKDKQKNEKECDEPKLNGVICGLFGTSIISEKTKRPFPCATRS